MKRSSKITTTSLMMTKPWLKVAVVLTFLVAFLSLQIVGKKSNAKVEGCAGPDGKIYHKKDILNVDECHIKKCRKKRNGYIWKLKLKKACCKYKKTVLPNGIVKEVKGKMVTCVNGKIEKLLSNDSYKLVNFKRNLGNNCHESHSVARNGFPLLANQEGFQDYVEDIESEQTRILNENSTWVCGVEELRILITNQRLIQSFNQMDWDQWFKILSLDQTRSFGLPWQSIQQNEYRSGKEMNRRPKIQRTNERCQQTGYYSWDYIDWECCTPYQQCGDKEGDCDDNIDCGPGLFCGYDNCKTYRPLSHPDGDCCYPEPACFPPQSIVTIEDGSFKYIEELTIGDSVLASNGNFKSEFSKFLGWLHRDEKATVVYLDLHTKNHHITISPKHLILKKGNTKERMFVMAKDITVGDNILTKSSQDASFKWESVQEIFSHTKRGAFAPLTEAGTIVVDNTVASCYAEISGSYHNLAHSLMTPIRYLPFILEDEQSQFTPGVRTYPKAISLVAKLFGNWDGTSEADQKFGKTMKAMNNLNIELVVLVRLIYMLKK